MREGRVGRLGKLRRMSMDEIQYRVCERLRSHYDRIQFHLDQSRLPDPKFLALFVAAPANEFDTEQGQPPQDVSVRGYLRDQAAPRFYLPAIDRERQDLVRLLADRHPEWIARAVQQADQICRHTLPLLGYGEVALGDRIDWHRDPLTGRNWPRRFWADYNLVREGSAGDPKTIHELNRHQHLPRLAKAYFLTGQERYAEEALTQIESWIDQNPEGFGIHWHSSLEIALRTVSWLWTLFFLLPARAFEERLARRMMKSLLAQLDHVYRYPSCYSSPNTHLLGEATALFLGGIVFRDLAPADDWFRKGAEILYREMERQVSAAGVHSERSSYYHCYAVDFYLQAVALAKRGGHLIPRPVCDRVCRMVEFLMHMTRPDGSIPLLGDDDGGRALALQNDNYRNFRDGLCTGAVLFGREDFKHQSGGFREETFWLLGERGLREYAALEAAPPQVPTQAYPEEGYFFQRSGWGEQDSHLVYCCGTLAGANGGHGHADALSLTLFAGGQDLLVDPGTFVYNGDARWRNFFRSARAHNTAVIDQQEPSRPSDTFSWSKKASGKAGIHFSLSDVDYAEAEVEIDNPPPANVLHRRALLHIRSEYWIVLDRFGGEGSHRFDLNYQFPPRARLALERTSDRAEGMEIAADCGGAKGRLFVAAAGPLTGVTACGGAAPIQGWMSERYGGKQAAPALRASFYADLPAAALTWILPASAALAGQTDSMATRPQFQLLSTQPQALVCALTGPHLHDLIVLSQSDEEIEWLNFKMRGRLFWIRLKDGVPLRVLAVDARSLVYEQKCLLQSEKPVPCLSLHFDRGVVTTEPAGFVEGGLCAEFAAS